MIMQYLPTSYRGKVIADGTIYVPCGICLSAAIVNIFFPLDYYNYFTFKDSINFERPSLMVALVPGGTGRRKSLGTVQCQSTRAID